MDQPIRTRHALLTGALLVSVLSAGSCAPEGEAASAPILDADYAFTGVNVIPMADESVLENQTVVVKDGVIAQVGPADAVQVAEGTELIDGAGHYLMPGLSEMHAHVPPQLDPPREVLEDIMFLYIANGITTIRGMLGAPYQIGLADELESGSMVGPTFYPAAPSLNGNTATDSETTAQLVRDHKAAGYDLLKIHPGIPLDSWDQLAATAEEEGISFAGHVPADVGLLHALETGMTCIDHLDGYVEAIDAPDLTRRLTAGEEVSVEDVREAITDEAIGALVQATVAANAYVVPTMYLWDNLYGIHDPNDMVALPEMRYVSQNQKDAWVRQSNGRGPVTPSMSRMLMDTRRRVLKALSDAGVGVLMGTDSPQMFNVPGFALHREIQTYEDAGMSRFEVLASGTRTVAQYVDEVLGLDGNFGTIEVGRRADLVLLGANPLESLSNLEARAGVMVRGHWVSGTEIQEGLDALEAKHASS
ncbi:MAG: amidohydrolase family protein [Longimicrobiales bacterium]